LARGGFCSETVRDEMEIFQTSSETGQELAFALIKFLRHALHRVSQELDYRIDICRVTKGAHIEHL
jgi:hypothetical protein